MFVHEKNYYTGYLKSVGPFTQESYFNQIWEFYQRKFYQPFLTTIKGSGPLKGLKYLATRLFLMERLVQFKTNILHDLLAVLTFSLSNNYCKVKKRPMFS